MTGEPIHVTDEAFEKKVLESKTPTLVDFWAPWCGPCLMVAPILEKLAAEYEGKLQIAKVNTDDHPKWAMQYGVQGIPTMLLIADGKVVHRQVGALPEPYLRDMVEEFLGAVEEASNGRDPSEVKQAMEEFEPEAGGEVSGGAGAVPGPEQAELDQD